MTTFYFVDDKIESVLQEAKATAGNRDVRISGGASVIQQYLNAGLVDELNMHVAPIMLGEGVRPFEDINKEKLSFEIADVINSHGVSHLLYKITNN